MFKIFYLKFNQLAIDTLPRTKRLINEHYVFNFDQKFFVMTSKPVKSTYIHTSNIEAQTDVKQYVIQNVHYYNPKLHIFEYSAKGAAYLAEASRKICFCYGLNKKFTYSMIITNIEDTLK